MTFPFCSCCVPRYVGILASTINCVYGQIFPLVSRSCSLAWHWNKEYSAVAEGKELTSWTRSTSGSAVCDPSCILKAVVSPMTSASPLWGEGNEWGIYIASDYLPHPPLNHCGPSQTSFSTGDWLCVDPTKPLLVLSGTRFLPVLGQSLIPEEGVVFAC